MLEGNDGALYGVTREGAAHNEGAVFRINKDGTGITAIHAFLEVKGARSPLIEGSDGMLYGVSQRGGSNDVGTVFRLQKNGTGFQVLKHFGSPGDGSNPIGGLLEASDGWLYGTTWIGGMGGRGTVFKLRRDGSDYWVLRNFLSDLAQPASPFADLVEGDDGALYGTSLEGGYLGRGTVFRVQKDGTGLYVLHSFETTNDAAFPYVPVAEGPDGALYGTGTAGGGTIAGLFKVKKDGTSYRVLRQFPGAPRDGRYPVAPVTLSRDGFFYGTTESGGNYGSGTVYRLDPRDDSYSIVFHFSRSGAEAFWPFGALTPDGKGNLYGFAMQGGSTGRGTIYRIRPGGAFEEVRGMSQTTNEGFMVQGLLVASDGNLYGTCSDEGAGRMGTLFKLAPDGSGFTVLHAFNFTPDDGFTPLTPVIEGSDGKLYGTTRQGGIGGCGTVYRINKDGTGYQLLHGFSGPDGCIFQDPLIEGSDGVLYGVTVQGGNNGIGAVFRMNRDGSGYLPLVRASTYLMYPSGRLLEASDGFLYGVAGHIFRFRKDGADHTAIFRFTNSLDGGVPSGPLWEGNDGALYGSTQQVGIYNYGVLFKVNKNGTGFTVLHHFDGGSLGRGEYPGIVRGDDGAFYGGSTSWTTGDLGLGVIYRFGHMIGLARESSSQLKCTGIPGIIYEMQRSTDLQQWTTLFTGPCLRFQP